MSSSLTFLTSELQALSKEAGRRHPDVKEAADRALATLKANPDNALADLHQEQDGISTSGPAKHPILLAPIVLGCATRNTKVVSIAVSGLQRLTGIRGAITQATVPVILNTLRTVLSQGVEIQLKTLQTLSSLLTNCKEIHADLLAETLLISFKLQESKIGVVSSTAAATLRQLVMFVFEAVDDEDRLLARSRDDPSIEGPVPTDFTVQLPSTTPDEEADNENGQRAPYYLLPSAKDAYLLFEDICLLVNGESPSFLKLQSLPRTFGLELIESVLSDFSQVFRRHPELLHLLRTLLSPLLIRSLAEKPSFSTTLRLMRVMYLLLKKFIDDLTTEAEIFLSMFIKIVAPGEIEGSGGHPLSHAGLPSSSGSTIGGKEVAGTGKASNLSNTSGSGSSPPWMRVLALEILRGLCGDFEFLSKIFTRYDGAANSDTSESPQMERKNSTASNHDSAPSSSRRSVFRSMITALNRLATERPALLGTGTALVQGVPTDPNAADYSSVSGMVDGIVGIAQQAASTVGVAGHYGQEGLSLQTASVKLQCIDQLDKADAPNIPELYIFLLALQCLNAIADGFAGSALQAYQTLMNLRPRKENEALPAPPALDLDKLPSEPAYNNLQTTKAMADAGWPALLASLSFFLTTNLDDDLFTHTLTSYQNFTTTCGVLNLKTPRDAFLINLCKFAVPPSIISHLAASENTPHSQLARQTTSSIITASTDALGLTSQANQIQAMSLSTRNLLCLRSLVGVSQALAGSLEKTWFYIFEALQNADFVVRADISRRQKKRSTPASTASTSHSSPAKTASSGMAGSSSASSSTAASTSLLSRFIPSDADEQAAQQRNARLFEVSRALDDDAFRWFVASLCRLNGEMIGIPTSETGGYNDADSSAIMSPVLEEAFVKQPKRTGINVLRTLRHGERSYATTKLGEVALMNMQRLIARPSEIGWDIIISHLLLIQHWQSAQSNVRTHAAEVFDKIVSAVPKDVEKEPEDAQRRAQEQVLQAISEQAELQTRSQSSTDIEIRKASLDTLLRILESHGHALLCGWTVIFNILRLACPSSIDTKAVEQEDSMAVGRNPLLVRVAFPSLQLICSDFLAALSKQELDICIMTLAEFGKQIEDVNVALTAGNLLWQVSDHVQMKYRQTNEGHDYLDLWMALLLRLLELCSDRRQEVRDGAIQILWRSIELYGSSLDPAYWEQCLWKVIFPLLQSLNEGLRSVQDEKDTDGEVTPMGVPLLHKQWDDSKVLALASAGSVFYNELPTSLHLLDSFEKVCTTLVEYVHESFVVNRPPVATAAMKCLDRICTTVWQEDRKQKGVFVARTAWDACIAIGNQIVLHEKRDLTQQNLEAYTAVLSTLQAGGYIPFTLQECQQLLGILKGIITYPYSPDYRLDQDVLSPLQAAVLKVIDRVELSSHQVAAIVLEDLSEYMSLAYTHDGQNSQPAAASAQKRQNQKVTYIALSKTSTKKIVEIYHRFKDESAIYASAVERIFSAYIIPLKLKYECPPPSRYGEEQPLWKTATLHFLELAKASVSSLDHLVTDVDKETVALIWRKIIEGYRAILEADNEPVLDMTLQQQRSEEDFEYPVLASLETDIVPKLGNSAIPDDAIVALARSLSSASNLYEPRHEEIPKTVKSPRLDGSLRSPVIPVGSTTDEIDLPRERFSYWCLDLLFNMCASRTETKRVSILSIPMLMLRSKRVLQSYLADAAVRGRFPFSRVREEELVYVLSQMSQLELAEGAFSAAYADATKDTSLSSACKQSKRAHLFDLYPLLVGILSLSSDDKAKPTTLAYRAFYSEHGKIASISTGDSRNGTQPLLAETAKTLARRCLEIVGQDLGHALL